MELAGHPGANAWIEENLGSGPVVKESFVGGSGWSSAYTVETRDGLKLFVKTALGRDEGMFKGEALGLQAMYDTNTLRIPKVYHYGLLGGAAGPAGGRGGSFIVMEYLDMRAGRLSMEALGRRLAQMHLAVPKDGNAAAGRFGFPVDNTIGGTPQANGWSDDWVAFLRDRRLAPQLRLTGDSKLQRLGDKLCAKLDSYFEGIEVRPSVLHGDLWSGNIGAVGDEPTIFDPATYYGHHEAEFGMSWCAGFSQDFWRAYHELIPRAPGFEQRADIYRLYHYLNHLNLFGDGYYSQCAAILQRLT
ncbi:hypothetical protein GPECTOR_7g1351 [Gonium pectorale]|uniref:protein-ribulosamine 3-kinase n=1 Tax=Gonium pectorale TaxID=33097 RepID=A0A150GUR9_GONPE|nr:hypothetical protein GPECTOR_7g1351 [Gonium pectorale]|eukprot:KXZ53452.1 hypothetical protein GPECTOR_7g1351 [Gonium pectorale]